jgi:hypothetical protein
MQQAIASKGIEPFRFDESSRNTEGIKFAQKIELRLSVGSFDVSEAIVQTNLFNFGELLGIKVVIFFREPSRDA